LAGYAFPYAEINWLRLTMASPDPCGSAPDPKPQPVRPPQSNKTGALRIDVGGGTHGNEKWMTITSGSRGSGSVVWASGSTCGSSAGVGRGTIEVACGVTLYFNAYDSFADGWDGTTYELKDGAGNVLANNSGQSPDDGVDDDYSGDWDNAMLPQCVEAELESSEAFVVPCGLHREAVPRRAVCVAPDVRNGECEENPVGGAFVEGATCTPSCYRGFTATSTSPLVCTNGVFSGTFECR
jgi:hypothetical protein